MRCQFRSVAYRFNQAPMHARHSCVFFCYTHQSTAVGIGNAGCIPRSCVHSVGWTAEGTVSLYTSFLSGGRFWSFLNIAVPLTTPPSHMTYVRMCDGCLPELKQVDETKSINQSFGVASVELKHALTARFASCFLTSAKLEKSCTNHILCTKKIRSYLLFEGSGEGGIPISWRTWNCSWAGFRWQSQLFLFRSRDETALSFLFLRLSCLI